MNRQAESSWTFFTPRKLGTFCLLFLLLVACGKSEPHIDEKFINAFVDMRIAETRYGYDSPVAGLARRDVLKKYGYTREEFLAYSHKILKNQKAWIPFQKRVVDRVDSLINPEQFELNKKKAIK